MSLQRLATPLASSALWKTATATYQPASQLCLRCLRKLYDQPSSTRRTFPRRRFVSAAAPKPQELEPQVPPRNAGVPETSIAGGMPQLDDVAKKQQQQPRQDKPSSISLPEVEAQQPQPTEQGFGAVGSVATPEPSPADQRQGQGQEKPKRKSKLRPRKAAVTLSPAAVEQLKELLNQPEPKLIRVGVKNRGCSGLAYHLEYVEKPGTFDEAVDQDGVRVLVDSKALFSIIGSEMDWVEDKLSRRFVFKNPNITEQCGCGESFSVG